MKNHAIYIIILLALVGCAVSSPPTSFYMIAPVGDVVTKKVSSKAVGITVDVNIPGYLERPQIVTRGEADTELNLSEFNRWLEPLASSLPRAVSENISSYMPKAKVRAVSTGGREFDYKVMISIDRFDGRFDDKVILKAWWSLQNRDNISVFSEDVVLQAELGSTYSDLVEKQSGLVNELSLIIAKRIAN